MENNNILNAQPPNLEWRVYRNDSTVLTIAMVDKNNSAIDLTGWVFTSKVRQMPTSPDVVTTPTIQVNQNFITLTLNTLDLKRINYFDIQANNETTNQTKSILFGTIYVEEDVTR